MSARYLMTCRCGTSIAVSPGQAGQEVPCTCGQWIAIPLLRELRSQPQASDSIQTRPERSQSAAPDSSLRNRVVYAGMLVTIFALLFGGILIYARSQIVVEWSQELQSKADSTIIDQMNADEMFQAWHAMHTQGLGEKAPTPSMINRNNRAILGKMAAWTLAFGALAAAGTAGFSAATRPSTPRSGPIR